MPPVRERSSLKIAAIGEAAVVGAGFGVALIGGMEIATAITAQQWLAEAKDYIDYAPLVSGAVAAIARASWIARRKLRASNRLPEPGMDIRSPILRWRALPADRAAAMRSARQREL